jgi:E3 ubiquitin-protein ligase SIAH1
MERLVESIRVPCPNAACGCNTRPAYFDHHGHCKTCPYAPYRCPSKECTFLGSTDALLDHLTGAHGWPSPTKISVFERHSICLYDGFNFLLADCAEDDNHGSTTTTICSSKYLFLLNVTRQSLGRAISVHLIGQGSPSEILRCVLSYSLVVYDPCERHKFLASHSLQSDINVECMDLSNGLPDPADCFHFVVPDSVLGDKNKEDPIQVNVCISIINLQ